MCNISQLFNFLSPDRKYLTEVLFLYFFINLRLNFLTSTPLFLALLTTASLAWPCLSIPKIPDPAQWDSLSSRSPFPNPWMVTVAEAANKKGLLPRLKPGAVTHFTPVLLNPFPLFSPSSLGVAESKLLPAHGQVHKPLTGTGTESMSQKAPQEQASRGHEAVILFKGTHGCFAGPNSMAHFILCWAELLWCWCGISNGQML